MCPHAGAQFQTSMKEAGDTNTGALSFWNFTDLNIEMELWSSCVFCVQSGYFINLKKKIFFWPSHRPAQTTKIRSAELWHSLCLLTVWNHDLLPVGKIQLFPSNRQWQLGTGRLRPFPTASHDSLPTANDTFYFFSPSLNVSQTAFDIFFYFDAYKFSYESSSLCHYYFVFIVFSLVHYSNSNDFNSFYLTAQYDIDYCGINNSLCARSCLTLHFRRMQD